MTEASARARPSGAHVAHLHTGLPRGTKAPRRSPQFLSFGSPKAVNLLNPRQCCVPSPVGEGRRQCSAFALLSRLLSSFLLQGRCVARLCRPGRIEGGPPDAPLALFSPRMSRLRPGSIRSRPASLRKCEALFNEAFLASRFLRLSRSSAVAASWLAPSLTRST